MTSFAGRQVEFVAALRAAGLPVSVAEDLDAVAATRVIELLDREQLRAAYAAALVKRQVHRAAFDTVFDLFFPPTPEPTTQPPAATGTVRRDDPELVRFRAALAGALRAGDDAALRRLARDGVARFGAVNGRLPGTQSWSGYAAQTRISPQTLLAGLLESVRGGRLDDSLAERNARTMFAARIARFRQLLDTEVQRRLADEAGREKVTRTAVRPGIDRVDLLSATRADLVSIRREIQPLARRLAARVAIEQRAGRRGPLDFRRTIRSSLSTGGTPIETVHRPRRPHKTDLVILCDVSESVTSFARFTLLLVHALRQQFSRVRVFAFIDELDEVTGLFAPQHDIADSVAQLAQQARVRGWSGRTDYGRAFELFAERYADAITARSSLLILGDARSNYGDPGLRTLALLADRARRSYWLNPERRTAWDTGDSVATDVSRIVPMVECRNLAQLGAFVRDLI